jgi:hypothetical protein
MVQYGRGERLKIYARHIEKIANRKRITVRKWFVTGKLKGFKDGNGNTASWYTTQEFLEAFIRRPLTAKELCIITTPQIIKRVNKCYNKSRNALGRFSK